ncbi:MAG: DUF2244 domain-containing protein [Rhodospirillales bacterium]|nr:DUF2244 domain-containing protein [Rhodospirillales bacterium]MBO6787581.1 DUF2244 domain-containing protein [Rhodospirillales bacterium]
MDTPKHHPGTEADPETIRFSRVLRPHRSSTDRAIKIVTYFVLFLFIPTGTAFLIAGAWPVFGLMGLEVAGLIFALRYNHKVGSAFEAITITEHEFRFSRVDHWGKRRHWTFQPQWLQFRVDGPSKQLIAGTHGKRIVIGKFLNMDEKLALCALLQSEINRLGDIRYENAGAVC